MLRIVLSYRQREHITAPGAPSARGLVTGDAGRIVAVEVAVMTIRAMVSC